MTTHPVVLIEFCDEATLEEVAPVHDAPKHVHHPIKLLLVFDIAHLPIPQRERQICCQESQHGEGEHECGAVDNIS